MKKTPRTLGIIGSVIFALMGIGMFMLPRFLRDLEPDTRQIFQYIGYGLLAFASLGMLLSNFILKSKAACIILILLGIPLAGYLLGLFYVIAGAMSLKNMKEAEPAQEENADVQPDVQPSKNYVAEEASASAATQSYEQPARRYNEEDDEEIDISKEQRPQGRRFGGKWYPSKGWFSANGVPVKEIPVDKRTLKSMSDEQKYVVALASFAIVKAKAIFIILTFIIALIIGFSASSAAGDPMGYVFTIIILLFVGGFLVMKPAKLIDGFTIVNGSFKDRIGLPFYWDLIFALASLIATVWSFFPNFVLILFDMTRREKMLSMPRVGVPQNIGFDDMIYVYSAYERACSIDDAFNQATAAAAKRSYDRKQSDIESYKTQVGASSLSASDKQTLINAADRVKQHNEDVYNNDIKPNL